MSRLACVVLSLGTACAAMAQDAGTTIRAPEAGFQITIPEVGWGHRVERAGERLVALFIGGEATGGLIQLSIQVSAADGDVDAARAQVRELRASVAPDASITDAEDVDVLVAGRPAPGLRVVQSAYGREFRVHVAFLHAQGFSYRIQFHAPREQFDDQWTIARRVLDGFELIELGDEAREQVRLKQLALRCGSEVDWAPDWDAAAQRARDEGRLVVVAIHAQRGFEIGDALNEGVFIDRDVLALMQHRLVGMRWSAGQPAPFVDHAVFGLSGSTFGVGLLVCTPDGDVVRQIFLIEPTLVADALRAVLAEHPHLAPVPPHAAVVSADTVAFLIDSGQLDAARTMLDAPELTSTAHVLHQRARLHRIERRGAAAVEAIEQAVVTQREDPESGPPLSTLVNEAAAALIGMDQLDKARRALETSLAEAASDTNRARATLWLGVLDWAEGDVDGARAHWTEAAGAFPDEAPAWQAAAMLLGPILAVDVRPRLGWPTEVRRRMASIPAPAAGPLEITTGLTAAVDWLVAAQRADGGWDQPFAGRDRHPAPSQIPLASQAICTLALARTADALGTTDAERAARCHDAALRGLDRYLADRALARNHPRPVAFMDYTCWGSSYGLFFLTSLLRPELDFAAGLAPGVRTQVETEAEHLVGDLVRIQASNGGWSYYVSSRVDGSPRGAAMSFTTATVLLALDAARSCGLDVPSETLERGFACLASLRGTNGVFDYMRMGDGAYAAGEVGPAGAAARGPVCTLALQRGGVLDADAMQPAFTTYVEHLGGFGAEARKALMHAGLAGQGSHYLLYDYSTAADALRASDAIDAGTRAQVRAAILRELARCRNADGSFVDNPLIGCAPGTGLAVLTLLDLGLDMAATP